jgi:hypothetical protein
MIMKDSMLVILILQQTSGKTVEQRRLRCSLSAPGVVRNGNACGSASSMDADRHIAQLISEVSGTVH